MAKRLKIENGQVFNRWTIINEAESIRQPNGKLARMFICQCVCKQIAVVALTSLTSGSSKSCGCYMREINGKRIGEQSKTHGNTPIGENEYKSLFFVWNTIKQRCYNTKTKKYSAYGGRGIKVCNEWLNSFIEFRDWAIKNGYYKQPRGIPFKDKLSIDRINNDGDYCPENCRWITISENVIKKHNKKQTDGKF